MACADPSRDTVGWMQSRCRDDNGSSLTPSPAPPSSLATDAGSDVGKVGRRSSSMNCDNCECVRDV